MTLTAHDATPVARHANGRFGAGNPGRPIGSRNRISRRVINLALQDFEDHSEEVLRRLRDSWLPVYARFISGLLAREGKSDDLPDLDAYTAEEVRHVLFCARAACDRIEDGRGSLIELQAALMGEDMPQLVPAGAP